MIFQNFSHGDVPYRFNGKKVNAMLEYLLNFLAKSQVFVELRLCANFAIFREANVGGIVFYKHWL